MRTVPGRLAVALSGCVLLSACGTGSDDPTLAPPAAAAPGPAAPARPLPPVEAVALLAQGRSTVLDVRTPQEFAVAHLYGARNLPLSGDFARAVAELPREGRYIVYCASGNRSRQAAQIMSDLGFEHVVDAGGLAALEAAGADVDP